MRARRACLRVNTLLASADDGMIQDKSLRSLTLLALTVFEKLEALEGSTASDQFVGELGLVLASVVVSVHLLVSILSVV